MGQKMDTHGSVLIRTSGEVRNQRAGGIPKMKNRTKFFQKTGFHLLICPSITCIMRLLSV